MYSAGLSTFVVEWIKIMLNLNYFPAFLFIVDLVTSTSVKSEKACGTLIWTRCVLLDLQSIFFFLKFEILR